MNRTDSYDQLYCLVADLSETTSDPEVMEAFNLVAILHEPTRWRSTNHRGETAKRTAAVALLDVLQAAPQDLREALDLRALAGLLGDPR